MFRALRECLWQGFFFWIDKWFVQRSWSGPSCVKEAIYVAQRKVAACVSVCTTVFPECQRCTSPGCKQEKKNENGCIFKKRCRRQFLIMTCFSLACVEVEKQQKQLAEPYCTFYNCKTKQPKAWSDVFFIFYKLLSTFLQDLSQFLSFRIP